MPCIKYTHLHVKSKKKKKKRILNKKKKKIEGENLPP